MLASIKPVNYKPLLIRTPILVPRRILKPRRSLEVRSNLLIDWVKPIGDGIIYFTIFYCTLNWWHYKNLNSKFKSKSKDD